MDNLAKSIPQQANLVAVSLLMCWYNFCRVHQTLRVTLAMESGLTDHIWTVGELLEAGI
jgi:hypothetical protein